MVTLNTGSSVVDFLKSTGKPSDFTSRKSLYETSGLKERLGDYTGSKNQNAAFLKSLQTSTGPVVPTGSITPTKTEISPEAQTYLEQGGTLRNGQIPEQPKTEISATDALGALGYNIPSPNDIASQALDSQEFQTFQEGQGIKNLGIQSAAAEDKAALEGKAVSDTKKTIDSFGSRGLFFSGMREGAVDSIVNNLVASQLGVDREVAQKLIEQGQATKEEFIKIAGDIAKKAQEGNKEALRILEAQGLTIGIDGKTLVPTLAARNAERADENAEIAAQREERMAAQQAQTQANFERTAARLEKNANASGYKSGKLVYTGQDASEDTRALESSRGEDGYVDPTVYQNLYKAWINEGGELKDFISQYPPTLYVNPANTWLPKFLMPKASASTSANLFESL